MRKNHEQIKNLAILATVGALLSPKAGAEEMSPMSLESHPEQEKPGLYTKHFDQKVFYDLVKNGKARKALKIATREGNLFFNNMFLADSVFGVGARVGQNQRFTRTPRADLKGPGEWFNHIPARAAGPSAQACVECHTVPAPDGAGFIVGNATRDPFLTGLPQFFINRTTTHTFGLGAVQRLAEEMNQELQGIEDRACASATSTPKTVPLSAKGIQFGTISVEKNPGSTRCNVDYSKVEGVSAPRYVIAPFQWKGIAPTIRGFNDVALSDEMGMQASEMAGFGLDGDFDGTSDEVSVGDVTALTVYMAAQPRPTSLLELADYGVIPRLSRYEVRSIERGRDKFKEVGCAMCHAPELKLNNSIFSEPSQNPNYAPRIFPVFPGILDPRIPKSPAAAHFFDPQYPIQLDLTKKCDIFGGFLEFEKDENGKTKVELYSDLKRHDMGPEDAESIDEVGTGASVWITRPLWGLGSTAPYMHDGRATTIDQAIDSHGGEAAFSRALYRSLPEKDQKDLDAFLMNLRLYKNDENSKNEDEHE